MEAVIIFGPAATMQEFSKKLLKCQEGVGGELTKCATLKTQAAETAGLRVCVGMLKREMELKLFYYMLRYNGFFVAQNL